LEKYSGQLLLVVVINILINKFAGEYFDDLAQRIAGDNLTIGTPPFKG
jgi:hypothetical protein